MAVKGLNDFGMLDPRIKPEASCSLEWTLSVIEALPEVLGNRGTRAIFSGELGNKGLKVSGTGEHRQFMGTGNIENQHFVFGEQGRFFQGTREQVPP